MFLNTRISISFLKNNNKRIFFNKTNKKFIENELEFSIMDLMTVTVLILRNLKMRKIPPNVIGSI